MRFVFKLLSAMTLLMSCCGCGGVFWGWSEWKLGAKSTPEPVEVDLAKLEAEAGKPLDNYHIKIGKHYACYWSTVYSYQKKKGVAPDKATTLNYAFYPIVSPSNSDVQLLEPLLKKYGALSKVPEDVDVPLPSHFVVLVKTTQFKTVGQLPTEDIKKMPDIQGLVINEVSSLKDDEKKLIQEEFPDIDFNKVLILDEGRKPSSTGQAITTMVVSAAVMVLGLVGLIGTGVLATRGGGKS